MYEFQVLVPVEGVGCYWIQIRIQPPQKNRFGTEPYKKTNSCLDLKSRIRILLDIFLSLNDKKNYFYIFFRFVCTYRIQTFAKSGLGTQLLKNPDNIPGSESAYRILFSCQEVAKMEGIALFDQVSYIMWHLR